MILIGDCREQLKTLADNSVDSIVTDPPYELGFMGKKWDKSGIAYDIVVWQECLRVLKPGGHLLSFSGSRTYHRMVCAIEDAGFEIRDQIMWVYGSGFPKGQNNLKPAHEPIVVARKPLSENTVVDNVLRWGTGAINVDGCRVGIDAGWSYPNGRGGSGWHGLKSLATNLTEPMAAIAGRWPANLIHDGSDEVVGLFPETGPSKAAPRNNGDFNSQSKGKETAHVTFGHDDAGGSAARFFYCAKASKKDREPGNNHPTVKPTDLMRYLCRLVTPPGGIVLDPFMGSGSTGKGATLEGFNFIGIELSPEYAAIAKARIDKCKSK